MAGGATRRRPSSCARSATERPTASSTSSRWSKGGSERSRRGRGGRSRGSAPASSRSATSSSSYTRAAGSWRPSPARRPRSLAPGPAEDPYRLAVGHVGLEACSRLFIEQDANPRAFHALTASSTSWTTLPPPRAEPALDPLVLSFQLKLLWLAGYLPHLASCASCGGEGPLVAFSPAAGGAVCSAARQGRSRPPRGVPRLRACSRRRSPTRGRAALDGPPRGAARDQGVVRVPRRFPPATLARRDRTPGLEMGGARQGRRFRIQRMTGATGTPSSRRPARQRGLRFLPMRSSAA